ncbi:MAG TPA: glycosyltransferase [Candidatus Sulfotelmatobacter sp.]|nr:glycosyltransferase [Candidatus Sulfotelmatobacter sp.]
MLTIAYLANEFPSPVEPYVSEEIAELRSRGVRVIAGSVRRPAPRDAEAALCIPQIVLRPPRPGILLRGLALSVRRWKHIWPLISRVLFHGRERPITRMKALAHTWLGACYAVLLESSKPEHIHVHHGYLGSWIAMVAARLLGVEFSMTLHGSDLLLHPVYLDAKLNNCAFCLTVSEYNRAYILQRYRKVEAEKVVVARLGVEVPECSNPRGVKSRRNTFTILAVGRLHPVKDHAFLLRACSRLQAKAVDFQCLIVGDGPERHSLESQVRDSGLRDRVTLMGHVARKRMNSWYERADVVVLTSRSEGIPLVLMEAMARGKLVLAPDITGIPELVTSGETGFLYTAGSLNDFVVQLLSIYSLMQPSGDGQVQPIRSGAVELNRIRGAAQAQVRRNFNREKRLRSFGDFFLQRIGQQAESVPHENFVLQQI